MVDPVTIPATNDASSTTTDSTTTNDYRLDAFTAWSLFRGTCGIRLRECIDREKLTKAIHGSVDIALAVYDTMSEDGDDFCITNLANDLKTIARQIEMLKDRVAPYVDPDGGNAEDSVDNELDTKLADLFALSRQSLERARQLTDVTLGNSPEVARDADAATLATKQPTSASRRHGAPPRRDSRLVERKGAGVMGVTSRAGSSKCFHCKPIDKEVNI